MSTQRLIVSASGRHFSIDVERVREIVDRGTITFLPRLPASIPGVIAVRDQAVPLIDLAAAVCGEQPRLDRRCVLIADDGNRPVGLLIDSVEWVDAEEEANHDFPLLDIASLLETAR